MKTETFDNPAEFLAALGGKKKHSRGGSIPRAAQSERTGLRTLLEAGWAYTFQVGRGHRFDKGELTTGWQEDEKTACTVAKGLL